MPFVFSVGFRSRGVEEMNFRMLLLSCFDYTQLPPPPHDQPTTNTGTVAGLARRAVGYI